MTEPKKIAILGGGMGALATAYYLSSVDDWQDNYDITVYQMGWRLGGKGASGRNQKAQQRIEEHGFHILFGFYENTFDTMRQCYKELDRAKDAPLAEFIAERAEDEEKYPQRYGMKRHSLFYLQEEFNGEWYLRDIPYPTDNRTPGDGSLLPSPWDYAPIAIRWMLELFQGSVHGGEEHIDIATPTQTNTLIKNIEKHLPGFAIKIEKDVESVLPHHVNLITALKLVEALPSHIGEHLRSDFQPIYDIVVELIELHLQSLWKKLEPTVNTDWDSYANWTLQDFVGTTMSGFLKDNLPKNGFDSINHLNFWEWFLSHATVDAGSQLTIKSTLIQGAYDSSFAYLHGDATSPATPAKPLLGQPDLEAGTMLRGGMRLLMGYKGAVSWMFQAGCGDVLFAPIYEVLKRRGVKFKFFHKVTALKLPASGEKAIDQILIDRQVDLYGDEYQPLLMVKGLPSWPSTPFYQQIVDGEAIEAKGVNLESNWTDWEPVEQLTLQRGVDFDEVVLGISLGALHTICADLKPVSETWMNLLDNVKTARTQSYQFWFNKTREELGWEYGKTAADVGVQPVNTWGDMTQEAVRENWAEGDYPKNIAYFCGPMADDPNQPAPPDPSYLPTQTEKVQQTAENYLNNDAKNIFPNAVDGDHFDWSVLVDPDNQDGEARLNSQYFRANIDPSERYVLSATGSTQYRPKAGESDFSNLWLAGDWIKTGVDAGCMEAATMSGMQCSRAMIGTPKHVPGETDFGFH